MFAPYKAPLGLCRGLMRSKQRSLTPLLCAVAAFALLLLSTRAAQAYPWMIRQGADPIVTREAGNFGEVSLVWWG